MFKALLDKLITTLGKWLHSTTADQWKQILTWVIEAEKGIMTGGIDKMAWVKKKVAESLEAPATQALFAGLSARAINWLVETAVGYLQKK
jgi:hypothetical protein